MIKSLEKSQNILEKSGEEKILHKDQNVYTNYFKFRARAI